MFERDPPFKDHAHEQMRATGELRHGVTPALSAVEARIESELDELDAAVISSSPVELRELRKRAAGVPPDAKPEAAQHITAANETEQEG